MKQPREKVPSLGKSGRRIVQALEDLPALPHLPDGRTPPAGWRRVALGELLRLRQEVVHPRDKPVGAATFVGLEHIESGTGFRSGGVAVEMSELTGRKPRFHKGDIVYGYLRPYLNKVWLAEFDGLCSVDQYVYEVDSGVADGEFLTLFMRSPIFLRRAPVSTSPGQLPRIRIEEVNSVWLNLPPLSEQRRIAAVLREQMAAVAAARRGAEEQRETAAQLQGTYRRAAFHDHRPISVHPLPAPCAVGWEWHSLRNVARLESGHTPSRYRPEWWGGEIPWLALPDIRALDCRIAMDTIERTNALGIQNSSARILPAGTVCLSRTASVGFVTLMGADMATSQDFANWVCGPELDPSFLMHALIASRGYLHSLSSGAIHKTIYMPTLREFQICAPSIVIQRRLARQLTQQMAEVDQLRRSLEEQLAAIGKLPAALLRRAFAGEL